MTDVSERASRARNVTDRRASPRKAAIALLVSCVVWGGSFTWAKAASEGINAAAGLPHDATLGPMLLLAWRFTLAGVAWFVLFPAARRGWSWASVGRAFAAGAVFAAGMITQQTGLTRTSEAVSAFLTSLSILFVPLLMTIALRKPPPLVMWVGVALATAGIWMMTGATPSGFGLGEVLGLSCSVIFSLYIFVMNAMVSRDDPWRMAGAQFLVIGVLSAIASLLLFPATRDPRVFFAPAAPHIRVDVLLLIIFATLIGFGIMVFYQPKLDPTRTALIYLLEPIFAAGYALIFAGKRMSVAELSGAVLILAANALVEVLESRKRKRHEPLDPIGPVVS
jgi:drug/metabolite transporter (DMT)-like permease